MSDAALISLVKSIRDGQEGSLNVQANDGEKVELDCVYKESIAPNFFIKLAGNALPGGFDQSAPITFTYTGDNGESVLLTARFAEVVNKRTVELTAAKSLDPASLREYFRVDFRTNVVISYTASPKPNHPQNWSVKGSTLDLSASGVLGLFPEECKKISGVNIEIDLVHPKKTIKLIGHVVRTKQLRGGRWHAALHFDEITPETRDDLISNCLSEQRRQLREKIQTT